MSNLKVRRGNEWITISGMPTVSSQDNGKILIVENGEWKVSSAKGNSILSNTPDWAQNDETASGYIENRTHWIIKEKSQKFQSILDNEIYFPIKSEDTELSYAPSNLPAGTLKNNQKYRFIISGLDSIYIAKRAELDYSYPFIYIGNLSLFDNNQVNTGESFLLISMEEGFDNYEIGNIILFSEYYENISISLLRVTDIPKEVHPLDKDFLPLEAQADWNENNNNSINYIQNRTHWADQETITTSYQYNNNPFEDNDIVEFINSSYIKKISDNNIFSDIQEFKNNYYLFIKTLSADGSQDEINFYKLTDPDVSESLSPMMPVIMYLIEDSGIMIINTTIMLTTELTLTPGIYFCFDKNTDENSNDIFTFPINLVKQITQPVYHTISSDYLPDHYKMKDVQNGQSYILYMKDGSLISELECDKIEVTTMPNVIYYPGGKPVSLAGMVVTLFYTNGDTKDITNYTYTTERLTHSMLVHITYNSYKKFTTTIEVGIDDYVDFVYEDNGDNTFTILDWKGTYRGQPSVFCVLPDTGDAILPH